MGSDFGITENMTLLNLQTSGSLRGQKLANIDGFILWVVVISELLSGIKEIITGKTIRGIDFSKNTIKFTISFVKTILSFRSLGLNILRGRELSLLTGESFDTHDFYNKKIKFVVFSSIVSLMNDRYSFIPGGLKSLLKGTFYLINMATSAYKIAVDIQYLFHMKYPEFQSIGYAASILENALKGGRNVVKALYEYTELADGQGTQSEKKASFAIKDAKMRFILLAPLDAFEDFFNVLLYDSFVINEGV